MKHETERFIAKIEQQFKLGKVGITEFEHLLREWRKIISERCYVKNDAKQTFLNLNQLKLTVQWTKQLYAETNRHLQDFIQLLKTYIDVELESLTIYSYQSDTDGKTQETKDSQSGVLRWTATKRSLIELIGALDAAKCINDGNITTQKIVVHFGELFGINLDNYHSEINKMSSRKPKKTNEKRAYFLEGLVEDFNNKIHNLK